ncbi:hypothetical protein HXX76_006605 [Chlamydomonas incerta]|uniref:Uncharacterized protein n=1 Tax=Chlamydomonas incerta TaxID=51695 RepID=A0A835T9J9_CHLIN|nr:hypothetical protein HXX76_006605 [Chlamydomonas incerta]|eukprot:KAG2436294.1 hypothetical protein HXX76_006605 [Chlamydomonas incerta]
MHIKETNAAAQLEQQDAAASPARRSAEKGDNKASPTLPGRAPAHGDIFSTDTAAPSGSKSAAAQALRRRVNAPGPSASAAMSSAAEPGASRRNSDALAVARGSNAAEFERASGSLYDTQETMDSATVQEILGSVDAHHVYDTKLLLSACNWDMDELLMREMNTYLN